MYVQIWNFIIPVVWNTVHRKWWQERRIMISQGPWHLCNSMKIAEWWISQYNINCQSLFNFNYWWPNYRKWYVQKIKLSLIPCLAYFRLVSWKVLRLLLPVTTPTKNLTQIPVRRLVSFCILLFIGQLRIRTNFINSPRQSLWRTKSWILLLPSFLL